MMRRTAELSDNQDGLAGAGRDFARRPNGSRFDAALAQRQVQPERRAPALGAFDPHMPARTAGEAVDHRQAKPGSLPDRLGREERLENLLEGLVGHANAGVAHADHDIVTGFDLLLRETLSVGQDFTGGDNRQRAPLRHRVARVDRQIEDRILELMGIRQRRPVLGGKVHRKPDRLAQGPPQHLLHAADQLIDIDRLGVERLAPGEGEQPVRQRCRATGRTDGAGP